MLASSADGRPLGETRGVDKQDLGKVVERLLRESLTPSSRRVYCSMQNRYLIFCSEGRVQPLLTNEEIFCRFVAWLFVQGLSHQTMKSYLSAVRHLQITSRMGDPFASEMPMLQYVLKGARIEKSRITPGARRIHLPITPDIMLKIKAVLDRNSQEFDNIMLWAAACACYFGFLRSGEITVPTLCAYCPESHLGVKDVSVDRPGRPEIIHHTLHPRQTHSGKEW